MSLKVDLPEPRVDLESLEVPEIQGGFERGAKEAYPSD
jgi:hypothetical protein